MSQPQDNAAVFELYGQDKLFNLLEDCLKNAPGRFDQVELVLEAEQTAVTRYAHNRIHQNVWDSDTRVWVRVLLNGAVASLACNSLDPAQIQATIGQAAGLARLLARSGQQHPGFAANTQESGQNAELGTDNLNIPARSSTLSLTGQSFFESTARQTPADRAEAISQITELVKSAGLEGFGTYKTVSTELAVANSLGLRAYTSANSGYLKALVESADGSSAGYADDLARDVNLLDPIRTASIAIQKCRLNKNQVELAPGDYATVLEPIAVADLMRFVATLGCGAQEFQDNRSFMSGRMGEQVTGTNINLWEEPHHPGAMPFSLDYEGLQTRPVPLIVDGRAAGVVYDRETARKAPGHLSTGHALSPFNSLNQSRPLPRHVVMEGTNRPTENLVQGLKRGLLVTRFHYTHCPDPRNVVATGTTRDGTFLVENGEIVAAVKNMRLTQSVLEILAGVEEFGQPRTCQDWWVANGMGFTSYYLPALRVSRCRFTGVTTF